MLLRKLTDSVEMCKAEAKMDKPVYLGLSLLNISKIAMHEYSHEYIKPKYEDNAKLCYMDTDNFIVHVKTRNFCKH